MKISKYRTILIIFLLYIVFWIIIISILEVLFRPEIPIALTRFIPLDDALLELGIIFIIILTRDTTYIESIPSVPSISST